MEWKWDHWKLDLERRTSTDAGQTQKEEFPTPSTGLWVSVTWRRLRHSCQTTLQEPYVYVDVDVDVDVCTVEPPYLKRPPNQNPDWQSNYASFGETSRKRPPPVSNHLP